MNILFMHNTLPAYRIPWFNEMSNMCNIKYVFTNEKLNQKIYKNKISYEKVENLDTVFLEDGLKGYNQLLQLMKEIKKYDFVELPPIDSLHEYIVSLIVYKYCKKNKIKIGYFWEKWEAPICKQSIKRRVKNLILKKVSSSIFKKVDIVFAGGSKSKEYFINAGVDKSKIFIIPDSSETEHCEYIDLRRKYNIEDFKQIVLYFGRIIPQKGLDILIKAYAALDNQHDYQLLIVGDGEFKEYCEDLAKELDVKNIIFVGHVHPDNRELYFSQCDIFVFPGTFRDGCVDVWGLTINEAIQHGKVVISTNAVGSAYDLIVNGENGFFINAENEEELVNALNLSSNEEFKINAKEKNKKIVKEYSYKRMADVYLNNIRKII